MVQLIRRDRFAKQVALISDTPLDLEKGQLIPSFYPFHDDMELQRTPHADDMRRHAVERGLAR